MDNKHVTMNDGSRICGYCNLEQCHRLGVQCYEEECDCRYCAYLEFNDNE